MFCTVASTVSTEDQGLTQWNPLSSAASAFPKVLTIPTLRAGTMVKESQAMVTPPRTMRNSPMPAAAMT